MQIDGNIPHRGSGKTSNGMIGALPDSVFVWCNDALSYPRALAEKLGRPDIEIVSPSFIQQCRFRGLDKPVAVDHAIILSDEEFWEIYRHNDRVIDRLRRRS